MEGGSVPSGERLASPFAVVKCDLMSQLDREGVSLGGGRCRLCRVAWGAFEAKRLFVCVVSCIFMESDFVAGCQGLSGNW